MNSLLNLTKKISHETIVSGDIFLFSVLMVYVASWPCLGLSPPRDTLKPYNKSPPEDKMHLEDWVEETIEEFLLEYVGD